MSDATEKIRKCRIKLLYREPFFAHLCMHLQLKGMPKELPEVCQSMGVNFKGDLYYSDEFVNSLSDDELIVTLCHEVLHLALEHMIRKGSRNAMCITPAGPIALWNVATDMVVNHQLHKYGYKIKFDIPNFYKLDLDEMSAEHVYDKLISRMRQIDAPCGFDWHGYPDGNGKNGQNGKTPHDGKNQKPGKNGYYTQKEIDDSSKKWRKATIDAATIAKQMGKLPADLQRLVDDTIEPKKRWRELLWAFITNEIPSDFTYMRPSKKSISCGFYMPSMTMESIDIVVAVDTSGSISDQQFSQFVSEMIAISRSFNYVNMTLIDCDASIKGVYEFRGNIEEEIHGIKFRGYGGTDFRPVFKWIEENSANCKVLIYLTDGMGSYPEHPPKYSVIWALTEDCDAPWGNKIILDIHDE